MTGDENEEDLALEQVKEAEGEVQVEVTVGGKRIIRKRKLAEHEDVTVGTLFIAAICLSTLHLCTIYRVAVMF